MWQRYSSLPISCPWQIVNLGGLVSVGGVMRLDRRLSVRIDAQQYLFSSPLDLVILAGFSWLSD